MAASISKADRCGLNAHDGTDPDPTHVAEPCEWWAEPTLVAGDGLAWVRPLYDDWVARLGAARMENFLARLSDQMAVLEGEIRRADAGAEVERLAHDVASTAGMMGFTDVTRRCRRLRAEADAMPRLLDALRTARRTIAQHLGRVAEAA